MPELRGLPIARAIALTSNLKLQLIRIDTMWTADTVELGRVVKQSPLPKMPVRAGDSIALAIKQYRPMQARPVFVRVPDVRGLQLSAAISELNRFGLTQDRVVIRDSFTVAAKVVLFQRPPAGESVMLRSPVTLVIASDSTIVPDLTTRRADDAPSLLAHYQLALSGRKGITSGTEAPGSVLGSHPSARTKVPKGSSVSIDVAVAPQQQTFPMPDLSGLPVSQVIALTSKLQLQLARTDTVWAADTLDLGRVVKQNPLPKAPVSAGDPVVIAIRQNRPVHAQARFVRVPDVRGLQLSAALDTLKRHGLTEGRVGVRDDFSVAAQVVLIQRPPGGDSALLRSPVSLTIASDWTVVPDITGRRTEDARSLLAHYQLVLSGRNAITSATDAPGSVLSSHPSARTKVPKGSSVSIDVAEAPPTVEVIVPGVVGAAMEAAQQNIESAGLRVGRVQVRDAFAAPTGTVLEQFPAEKARARPGSGVDLWIASEWTLVPELRQMRGSAVEAALTRHRLSLGAVTVSISDSPAGSVLDQRPAPQTRVRKESPVAIQVARAAPPPPPQDTMVIVPPVTGRLAHVAADLLDSAGLQIRIGRGSDAAPYPVGTVVEQNPPAGTRVRHNSLVEVVRATDSTTVPLIVGHTITDARALLESAFLTLTSSEATPADQAEVLSQTPAPGMRVPKRSAVAVTLPASAAPTVVTVPDLIGLSRSAAEARLTSRGLLLAQGESVRGSGQEARTVATQQPAAGSQVSIGSAVIVDLERAPIPWFIIGTTAAAAAVAAVVAAQRWRRNRSKKEIVAEPTIDFFPDEAAVAAQLRADKLAGPPRLALVGVFDEEESEFELHYDDAFTKGGKYE